MTNEKLTLQDIAQRASSRNGGARGRALDRIAKQRGLTLSYTTVDKILQGKYTSRPGEATLTALASLSDVPLEDVFDAAGQTIPQARLADQLPPEVDRLTPEQRRVVIDLARVFVRQNRELEALKGRDGNVSTAPITQAGESPAPSDEATQDDVDLAAYETGRESQGRRLRRLQDEAAEAAQD
ncbi:hypothetical protein PTW37_10045 [Arthrobacter agilis]|uniref:hypothetical protein n=1 Tax=Arthrobacter agilis TaxID=37921 RepID=UPI002366228A|nr:hypothetical protein [Arthrobacter agilis]WDF32215.1 hypothetical protein PTW37_10045 [Arthrobacter agilis]